MAAFLLCNLTEGVLTFKGKQRLGLKERNFGKHYTPPLLSQLRFRNIAFNLVFTPSSKRFF